MTTCSECKFTGSQDGGSMICHRYPQPHRVAQSYWCGEYQPRVAAAKAPSSEQPKKRGLRAALASGAASED